MQPRIRDWPTISQNLDIDCIGGVTQAFRDDSLGLSVIPPIGERQFEAPCGELISVRVHTRRTILYPSGFYEDPTLGLPSSHGKRLFFFEQSIVVLK